MPLPGDSNTLLAVAVGQMEAKCGQHSGGDVSLSPGLNCPQLLCIPPEAHGPF